MKQIIILILVLFVVGEGVFISRGSATSQGQKPAGLGMKQQHQTMRDIDVQWKKLTQALAKDDFPVARQAVQKILGLAPNINKFQPHQGPDKRDQFAENQKSFVQSLVTLKAAIIARDRTSTEESMKAVDNTCNQCHTAFGGGHQHSPKSKGR